MNYSIYTFSLLLILGLTLNSCGNKAKNNPDTDSAEMVDKTGIEYTSAYICPMHCKGSGSEKPGECPVCKMKYVVNKDHNAQGHDHSGHDHDGHDHSNHDGHNHGDHDGHNH